MCGICGIYCSQPDRPIDADELKRMIAALRHRGPDEEGCHLSAGIGLGVRRLSIIDPECGQQPAYNEDRTIIAILNGELYNYKELRQLLQRRGHRLVAASDTEVLPHLYEDSGVDLLQSLEGMFALAIYDMVHHRLIIARDRLGMKPMFLYQDEDRLCFSSELKAIETLPVKLETDYRSIAQFFFFEYIPAPATIFSSVTKLLPGEYLLINGSVKIQKQYWQLPPEPAPPDCDRGKRLQEHIENAVSSHLIADVPVGLFLSGGLDSTVVLGSMNRLGVAGAQAFTISFRDRKFNESTAASRVAHWFGASHTVSECNAQHALASLEKICGCTDEPFADASLVPTYFLAALAVSKVKVALSGEGGDEIFGGYLTYQAHQIARRLKQLPAWGQRFLQKLVLSLPGGRSHVHPIFRLRKFIRFFREPPEIANFLYWGAFSYNELLTLMKPDFSRLLPQEEIFEPITFWLNQCPYSSEMKRMFYLDLKLYLQDDLLVKVDRAAMANSLEVRMPYLDRTLVEFCLSLPETDKINYLHTKVLFRKTYRDLFPKQLLNRRKQGFDIPLDDWLRDAWRPFLLDTLYDIANDRDECIDGAYVSGLINEHLAGHSNHRQKLWTLINYALWRKRRRI